MQSTVTGFKINVPGLEEHFFPPGTTVLLSGKPGVGKSAFAKQFIADGLMAGECGIYVATDSPAETIHQTLKTSLGGRLEVLDLFMEKPRLINDISIAVHQKITNFAGQPIRVVYDSLSTLGILLNPGVIPPWILDQRARFTKNNSNVLGLMVLDTGIHPPQITRSLQILSDVVLEMKLEEDAEEPNEEPRRLFRVFSTKGTQHSAKWYQFTIENSGLKFTDLH